MSGDNPEFRFPYPKDVIYSAPPWAGDVPDPMQADDGDGDYDGDDDGMDGEDGEAVDRSHAVGYDLPGAIDRMRIDSANFNDFDSQSVWSDYERYVPETDDEDESAPYRTLSTDLDQGTFGVELEFLVVQCPAGHLAHVEMVRDPHPEDPRWCSQKMSEWEWNRMDAFLCGRADSEMNDSENNDDDDGGGDDDDDKTRHGKDENNKSTDADYYDSDDPEDHEFFTWFRKCARYTRTKLTRVLRDKGLVVIKWPEGDINPSDMSYVAVDDFSGSEASDDEREESFPNSSRLDNFNVTYDWDPSVDTGTNVGNALLQWEKEYVDYHKACNLKLYRTRIEDIEVLAKNQCRLNGAPTASTVDQLAGVFIQRLKQRRVREKQQRENMRNSQIDPLHVPVAGLRDQYKAWTVTVDLSVDGNGMRGVPSRYNIPPHKGCLDAFSSYHWFGAEVVSPVLPMGSEKARQAVRDACGSLRDALRCHKPMEVSTGLHIHLGHTKGWTLFQLKRFASLWFLTEETILHLHRKDRGNDRKWCAKIGDRSRLWLAQFGTDKDRRDYGWVIEANHSPALMNRYVAERQANVSLTNLTPQQASMIFWLWQYNSITKLHEGLGETELVRTGLKWRVRGQASSLELRGNPDTELAQSQQPGTVEVRIMQGTLDADHINNWVVVLQHIVQAVRNLSDEDFQALLAQFVLDQTRERLLTVLGVPDDVRDYWLDGKRRDATDSWWEYPDKDKVDWGEPFMVPGYGATHGPQWD